jgi:hypothetical protein
LEGVLTAWDLKRWGRRKSPKRSRKRSVEAEKNIGEEG